MVPAAYAYKTDGFQHPIFTRGGCSSSSRRGVQRFFFTRQSGSGSLCLQDRWIPVPIFRREAGSSSTRRGFQHSIVTRDNVSSGLGLEDRWVPAPGFYEGELFQQHTAWVPAPNCHEGQCSSSQRRRPMLRPVRIFTSKIFTLLASQVNIVASGI